MAMTGDGMVDRVASAGRARAGLVRATSAHMTTLTPLSNSRLGLRLSILQLAGRDTHHSSTRAVAPLAVASAPVAAPHPSTLCTRSPSKRLIVQNRVLLYPLLHRAHPNVCLGPPPCLELPQYLPSSCVSPE